MKNLTKARVPAVKLILGLGNPGPAYRNTRHNAGLAAIEHLLKSRGAEPTKKSPSGMFEYAERDGLIYARSSVFMNKSGLAVAAAVKQFGLKPENILIIHDDSDLELGKFKLSLGRGAAGHKGAESVINKLGTNKFFRLRIGVRRPSNKQKAEKFILKKMSVPDLIKMSAAMESAASLIEKITPRAASGEKS